MAGIGLVPGTSSVRLTQTIQSEIVRAVATEGGQMPDKWVKSLLRHGVSWRTVSGRHRGLASRPWLSEIRRSRAR